MRHALDSESCNFKITYLSGVHTMLHKHTWTYVQQFLFYENNFYAMENCIICVFRLSIYLRMEQVGTRFRDVTI